MPFETAKFFKFHGVVLDERGKVGVAACPFCEKPDKFYVDLAEGLWQCKVCNQGSAKGGGNAYTFLKLLLENNAATEKQYEALAKERKLLKASTLKTWGAAVSFITGEWLLPAYSPDGKLVQVYKYVPDMKGTGKKLLLASPSMGHGLFGVLGVNKDATEIWTCEGPWDGMAAWEMFGNVKLSPKKELSVTGNSEICMLAERGVVAVPGCNVWKDEWASLYGGKLAVFPYDSDHAKEVRGKKLEPVGMAGVKRVVNNLARHAEQPPAETRWVEWGPEGYDPSLKDGHDLRDSIANGSSVSSRMPGLEAVLAKVQPTPADWIEGGVEAKAGKAELGLLPCEKWEDLVQSWRKAMKWIPGLDHGLASMLATVVSTMSVGSQLWIRLIGLPSCGKSTLCEALTTNRDYVIAKSTLRGFHSGYRETADASEDNSLLYTINKKTMVTKDGDTLLQSPNLQQILSEARDVYDGSSRTSYRNKASKDYEGIRFSWILSGTTSLRALDTSEVGERFIDVVVLERIDEELEDEILLRVVRKAEANMSNEVNGQVTSRQDSDLTRAMQLTGGYVGYLRKNAQKLLSSVSASDEAMRQCIRLGKFVAFMRARPSLVQDEIAERELAARLVELMVRYAKCIAAVLNRKSLDAEVMRRTTMVALDTGRGQTMRIAEALQRCPNVDEGYTAGQIHVRIDCGEEETKAMLRFLVQIRALERYTAKTKKDASAKTRYRLTESFRALYDSVVPPPVEEEE